MRLPKAPFRRSPTRPTDAETSFVDYWTSPGSENRKRNKLISTCSLKNVSLLWRNRLLFHNVQIVQNLREGLTPIVVDPSQIQQVFMNMIINAAEAMNGDGRLTVTTNLDTTDEFIEIEFSDTGIGISEENIEKIFDPFFTTKEAGHGTGLGLAISYGIVKEHNGSITVHSEVGKGTTFVISLPLFAVEENNKQGNNGG